MGPADAGPDDRGHDRRLLAVIGTLVGSYFGMKAGLDGQYVQQAANAARGRDLEEERQDRARERQQREAERKREREQQAQINALKDELREAKRRLGE